MLIREIIGPLVGVAEAVDPALAALQQQQKQLKLKKAQLKASKAQKKLSKVRAQM